MQALHHALNSKYQAVYFTAHARGVPNHDIYARALRMRACALVGRQLVAYLAGFTPVAPVASL